MIRAFAQGCIGGVGIACTGCERGSIVVDGGSRDSKCSGDESSLNENGLHPNGASVERE